MPDHRAQAVAIRAGIDISGLQARQVQQADFERFTHIVALDRENLSVLQRIRPAMGAELSLLLDHVPERWGQAIADPYYGTDAGFDVTWSDVTEGARALVQKLS